MRAFKIIALVICIICLAILILITIQARKVNEPRRSSEDYIIKGWVARDKDGTLWFCAQKPYRSGDIWVCEGAAFSYIKSKLLPSLTWKDKPIRVKLVKDK